MILLGVTSEHFMSELGIGCILAELHGLQCNK
jgi:hypothetical protein